MTEPKNVDEMKKKLVELLEKIEKHTPEGFNSTDALESMDRDEELCAFLNEVHTEFMKAFVEHVNSLLEGYEEFGEKYQKLVDEIKKMNKATKAPDNIKKNIDRNKKKNISEEKKKEIISKLLEKLKPMQIKIASLKANVALLTDEVNELASKLPAFIRTYVNAVTSTGKVAGLAGDTAEALVASLLKKEAIPFLKSVEIEGAELDFVVPEGLKSQVIFAFLQKYSEMILQDGRVMLFVPVGTFESTDSVNPFIPVEGPFLERIKTLFNVLQLNKAVGYEKTGKVVTPLYQLFNLLLNGHPATIKLDGLSQMVRYLKNFVNDNSSGIASKPLLKREPEILLDHFIIEVKAGKMPVGGPNPDMLKQTKSQLALISKIRSKKPVEAATVVEEEAAAAPPLPPPSS